MRWQYTNLSGHLARRVDGWSYLLQHGDMAKLVTTTVTDDIDDSANAEEVRFAYKGSAYSIDLGPKNAAALDHALAPYIAAATRIPTGGRSANVAVQGRRAVRPRKEATDVAVIRAWALSEGRVVSTRGRLSQTIVDAYQKANP